jgi:hypothetical protein
MDAVSSVPKTTDAAAATGTPSANVPAPAATPKDGFKDALKTQTERLQHVKGHHYAKHIGGDHDGMYVNRTHNERAGQDFAIVRRDGRVFHVYGDGKDRTIVEIAGASAAPGGAATPDPAATTGGDTTSKTTSDTPKKALTDKEAAKAAAGSGGAVAPA